MKSTIHPQWNHAAKVTCACGEEFLTGSVSDSIQVDICSKCHPFFTGEMKYVDIQGRVDKFLSRQKVAQNSKASKKTKKDQPEKSNEPTLSLKELLQEEKKRIVATE